MATKKATTELKRQRAIVALLETGRTEVAAERAGVNVRTVQNWLSEPEFKAELLEAKDSAVQGAIARLSHFMGDAVGVAAEVMNNPENAPRDRVAASKIVLDYGYKFWEHTETQRTLLELEKLEREELEKVGEPDDLPEQLERQKRQEELARKALGGFEEGDGDGTD